MDTASKNRYFRFLSTLSLRRATGGGDIAGVPVEFLSTLSLRRATTDRQEYVVKAVEFLSTLSLRRATENAIVSTPPDAISIHALLAESDSRPAEPGRSHNDFYPRSPCGERHAREQEAAAK